MAIRLVDARFRAIDDNEHFKLVNVPPAIFEITLAAGVEGNPDRRQSRNVHGRGLEDLIPGAVFIVEQQMGVPTVINQLRNSIGHDHASRTQRPIAIGWDIGSACMAQVRGIRWHFVFEILEVEILGVQGSGTQSHESDQQKVERSGAHFKRI